jgi:hypothetical protein
LQQLVVIQGDLRTRPIHVHGVRWESRLNEATHFTISLSLQSERVLCDSSGIAIDGVALSAESIEAVSQPGHFCWDLEVELIPRERIDYPHENIHRLFAPVHPMVVTAQRRRMHSAGVYFTFAAAEGIRAGVAVENIRVGEFVELGADRLLRRARSIPEEFSHLPRVGLVGIDYAEAEPPKPQAPTICQNCRNYHGQSYGGNFMVCGIHPYGNGEDCSDAE